MLVKFSVYHVMFPTLFHHWSNLPLPITPDARSRIYYYMSSNLARSKVGRISVRSLNLTAAKRLASGSPDLCETAVLELEEDCDDEVVEVEDGAAPPFA
jgi:hypothetical protein